MVKHLPYFTLKTPPKTTALLKQEFADFIVKEDLGYEMSGEGEFVAGVKEELITYLTPLVQGEVSSIYENGMPSYLLLK